MILYTLYTGNISTVKIRYLKTLELVFSLTSNIRKSWLKPEVANLRPGGHVWPGEQIIPVCRTSQ